MSNKKITLITILISSAMLTGLLMVIYYPLFTVPENIILSRFYKVETIDKCKPVFAIYCIPEDRKWQIVSLNKNILNPLNPTFSVVYNENTGSINGQAYKYTNVVVLKLSRSNIFDFDWKVQTDNQNPTNDLDFISVVNLVKQADININNPDASKISNRPSPSKEEIERAKIELQTQTQSEKSQNTFNALSKDDQQKICLQQIGRQKALYESTLNGHDFEGQKTYKTNLSSIKYIIDNAKC